ncbi:WD40 repeat domain-containing protein [Streptomyces sp. cg40]|uniref:WD40 repeat domain-containing protein n=1 Tax=Streptomyces sp. cg40 TaxID=3419764 RepID=UPI003CFD28BE
MPGHNDAVTAVAFASDGRELPTGSADFTVRLWDVTAPRHVRTHRARRRRTRPRSCRATPAKPLRTQPRGRRAATVRWVSRAW